MLAQAKLPTGIVVIRVDKINPKYKMFEGECIHSTCPLNKEGSYAKNWDADVFETEADHWDGDETDKINY